MHPQFCSLSKKPSIELFKPYHFRREAPSACCIQSAPNKEKSNKTWAPSSLRLWIGNHARFARQSGERLLPANTGAGEHLCPIGRESLQHHLQILILHGFRFRFTGGRGWRGARQGRGLPPETCLLTNHISNT